MKNLHVMVSYVPLVSICLMGLLLSVMFPWARYPVWLILGIYTLIRIMTFWDNRDEKRKEELQRLAPYMRAGEIRVERAVLDIEELSGDLSPEDRAKLIRMVLYRVAEKHEPYEPI